MHGPDDAISPSGLRRLEVSSADRTIRYTMRDAASGRELWVRDAREFGPTQPGTRAGDCLSFPIAAFVSDEGHAFIDGYSEFAVLAPEDGRLIAQSSHDKAFPDIPPIPRDVQVIDYFPPPSRWSGMPTLCVPIVRENGAPSLVLSRRLRNGFRTIVDLNSGQPVRLGDASYGRSIHAEPWKACVMRDVLDAETRWCVERLDAAMLSGASRDHDLASAVELVGQAMLVNAVPALFAFERRLWELPDSRGRTVLLICAQRAMRQVGLSPRESHRYRAGLTSPSTGPHGERLVSAATIADREARAARVAVGMTLATMIQLIGFPDDTPRVVDPRTEEYTYHVDGPGAHELIVTVVDNGVTEVCRMASVSPIERGMRLFRELQLGSPEAPS